MGVGVVGRVGMRWQGGEEGGTHVHTAGKGVCMKE